MLWCLRGFAEEALLPTISYPCCCIKNPHRRSFQTLMSHELFLQFTQAYTILPDKTVLYFVDTFDITLQFCLRSKIQSGLHLNIKLVLVTDLAVPSHSWRAVIWTETEVEEGARCKIFSFFSFLSLLLLSSVIGQGCIILYSTQVLTTPFSCSNVITAFNGMLSLGIWVDIFNRLWS